MRVSPGKRLAVVPVVLIAIAAIAIGCGGGSDSSSTAPSTSTPTDSTAPADSGGGSAQSSSGNAVKIVDFKFEPKDLTVPAGTKVTFTDDDSVVHTATSDESGGFDTGTLKQGDSASVSFDKPGTYAYHCDFHAFMQGTITVK